MDNNSNMVSYVFDGVEVKLTGRVAEKTITLTKKELISVLVEIEPIDKTGPSWKKWVNKTELYEIKTTCSG